MKGISLIFKFVKQMASHSKLCGLAVLRATLDKGSGIKSLETN
jgi:hypothetical protein